MSDFLVFGPGLPPAFFDITRHVATELKIPISEGPNGGLTVHCADALTAHHVGFLTGKLLATPPNAATVEDPDPMRPADPKEVPE